MPCVKTCIGFLVSDTRFADMERREAMSPVITECEVHPTEAQMLQFNQDLFRRGGNRLFYILSGILFLILSVALFLSPELSLRWLSLFALACSVATVLQRTLFLRHSVHKMLRASPHLLRPHRVVLTEDAVLELPFVGDLPPYTEVNCPYDKLYEAICTREFYYFRYNMISSCLIPRTLLTPEQEQTLCERLKLCCGERFVILPY